MTEKIEVPEKRYKKGQVGVGTLGPLAVMLVVAGLIIAFSLQILGGMTFTAGAPGNAANNLTTGLGNLASQFPNIGTILGAVVIIGLLVVGLGGVVSRGRG